jgi:hypothetical protein
LSANTPDIVIFAKILAYLPSEPRYLIPIELKDSNSAAPGNDAIGERLKPPAHTTEYGMKPRYRLTATYLARNETSKKFQRVEYMVSIILRGHMWRENFQMSVIGEWQYLMPSPD